ncbi:MAG: hypothetical protein Q7U64_06315 [Desulfocapsaceae bacterium]|nr:hypothetical protein [Desulfocapsaceae bacterium]
MIPTKERETIHDRIDLLAGFPDVAGVDVKPLTGHPDRPSVRVSLACRQVQDFV